MAGVKAYVDPRPVRPAQVGGLLNSANNVVVGHDVEIQENATIGEFNFNGAYGPGEPPPPALPRDQVTGSVMDADQYARTFIRSEAPDDYEQPKVGARVRWVNGFAYRPEICNGGDVIDPFGTTEGTPSALEAEIDVTPFIVEGLDQRSTFGAPGEDEYAEARGYALRQLLACEGKQIEQELWKGTQSIASGWGNRYLADNHVTLPEGDRLLGFITALAVLEQAIQDGTCAQQGMIHCTAKTATLWVSAHLCHAVGKLLVTELGTIIVVGSGYDGSAPATGDAHLDPAHAGKVPSTDSGWAYATTIVDVRRGDLIRQPFLERFDPSINQLTTIARRPAAVTWGCLQAGVHVDHTVDISITGS